MKTTITTNSSRIPHLIQNPRSFLQETFFKSHSIKFSRTASDSISRSVFVVKCSENGSPVSKNGGNLKDMLTGMVDERVEELLNKEENMGLLDGLEQASLRVEKAKRELAEIEKQETEAKIMREYINQLESRASEIEECQKEIIEARTMVEEAERSLTKTDNAAASKDEERLESVKAASIAAVIGTLAELPISFTRVGGNFQLIVPLAITFVSCALFGVTFRYAVRKDLDDVHLKSGTSAAFGFVKGLGMLGSGKPIELEAGNIMSIGFDAAVYVSESVVIFLFAGVALDFCIKLGILSTFPIDKSIGRT